MIRPSDAYLTLITVGLSCFAVVGLTTTAILWSVIGDEVRQHYLLWLLAMVLMGAFPVMLIIRNLTVYPQRIRSLPSVALLYIDILIIFANIYFLIYVSQQIFFPDSEPPFRDLDEIEPNTDTLMNFALHYADLLYFSVITMTTIGYGDIRPSAWYSKVLVDLQALSGILIIVFAVGQYFSSLKTNH